MIEVPRFEGYSLDNKSIFISGGAGSLGCALAERLLKTRARRIVLFDNNQSKLTELERKYPDPRLRFFVGDVRDPDRLRRGLEECDVAIHAAALKIIPSCEYNAGDTIKTNVVGSQNFVEACLDTGPEIAVGVSSDKACSPLNLYGATKLCMERLFIAANQFKGAGRTIFTCVRYGNVLASAESVIPLWVEETLVKDRITVTNPEMTRFSITMPDAIDFILASMKYARGSEVFVPKMKAYSVKDLAEAFLSILPRRVSVDVAGVRIGEKEHEILINEYEMAYAYDVPFGYVIISPEAQSDHLPYESRLNLTLYSSATAQRLTTRELVFVLKKTIGASLESIDSFKSFSSTLKR